MHPRLAREGQTRLHPRVGMILGASPCGSFGLLMDRTKYAVRPFVDADFEAAARISTALEPRLPQSAAEIRHWDEVLATEPGRLNRKLAVEETSSREVVAWGSLTHTVFNYHPDKFWIQVDVLPVHQARGIGSEVYALLEREAVERRAVCLWASAREGDPPTERFLQRRGFTPVRKVWLSRLNLVDLDLSKFPDRSRELSEQGIRITTLAEEGAKRPEVRKRLYRLGQITSKDVPRLGDYTPVTFEEFIAVDVDGPKAIPEATFIAIHGDEYVAWSTLERELGSPDSIGVGFTGTLPQFRGRGIASELKRRAVEYARAHGYQSLITGNDSSNKPIGAINEKLGFRPEIVWVNSEKALTAPEKRA